MNSEIEECMNTITAALTRLRAHIRKLGMAGTEPELHRQVGKILVDHLRDSTIPLKARVAQLIGWEEPDELTIEWAMGALEEYANKNNLEPRIERHHRLQAAYNSLWNVYFDGWGSNYDNKLPQAICEAIANHAEGK